MKFKKQERILSRRGQPNPRLARKLKALAKKANADFVLEDLSLIFRRRGDGPTCYFLVEAFRGPASVEKRMQRIVNLMEHDGIGDARGAYLGDPWFSCKLIATGVTRSEIESAVNSDSSRGMKGIKFHQEVGDELHLYHENKFDPIRLDFSYPNGLTANISCETVNELSLLVAYLTGALTRHFPFSLETIHAEYFQEELTI